MSQNSALLANLINAVQKGLESGKLDISDMQYLQDHLDRQVELQIQSKSQELEKRYSDQLNTYLDEQKSAIDRRIRGQQLDLNVLDENIEKAKGELEHIKVPKWLQITQEIGVVGGAILAIVIPILLLSRSLELIYEWVWYLGFWEWLTYALIIIVSIAVVGLVLAAYGTVVSFLDDMFEKLHKRKNR